MLVRFIACRHLVMVTGRSVILKLRKKLVHAVAELVLSEMSVVLWYRRNIPN
jgi:putative Ca2+/H+ antiporter (TMEM165/GDT1 family)